MEQENIKKRGCYTTKKKLELENLLSIAKGFQIGKRQQKVSFKKNPATIAEFTKDVCLYPCSYLNNDNTCIKCDIYEHCACKLKNLGKKKRNES